MAAPTPMASRPCPAGSQSRAGVSPALGREAANAVERLALRAVAPRRAARRLGPPGPVVTRSARSARAESSQRDHSHHQMGTPSQCPDAPLFAPSRGLALAFNESFVQNRFSRV